MHVPWFRPHAAVLSLALLLAACGKPAPDAMLAQCLRHVAGKDYGRVLAYCSPGIGIAFSNHLWLTHAHRTQVAKTDFSLEPAEFFSATAAHVSAHITFRTVDSSDFNLYLRFDLVDKGRWIVEDVWHLSPNGTLLDNAIETLGNNPMESL